MNLSKEKQKVLKVLSKIISIIAIIGKVALYITAPIIILSLIIIPILFNKIEVKDDQIIVNNSEIIKIEENEKGLVLSYRDHTVLVEDNVNELLEFKEIFKNHSKGMIVGYVEISLVVALIALILWYLVLTHLNKLFNNIYKEQTPFTMENVVHIKKLAYYLIGTIILPVISMITYQLIFNKSLNIAGGSIGIMEILFLFVISYVFEYGYNLQSKSDGKIYGD